MIIFNEQDYYNNLIKNGFEKHINKRDLIILAKKLKSEKPNIENEEIKNYLINFCKKWIENFNPSKYENYILDVLKIVNEPQKDRNFIPLISFSSEELKQVMQLKDFNAQNLLFIIMCICKMYNRDNIYLNSKSSIKLKELCELAKVKLNSEKQMQLLHILYSNNMVEVGKNLKFTLIGLKNENNSKIILEFAPNKFMITNFTYWRDANYTKCQKCGLTIVKTSNNIKYCENCAKLAKNKQNKESLLNKK